MIIGETPSLLHALWRYKLRVLGAAVAAGFVAFGLSMLQPTVYTADGVVFFDDPRGSASFAAAIGIGPEFDPHVHKQAALIESDPVAQRAAEVLADGTTSEEVQAAVSAVPTADINGVRIRTTAPTADESVAIQAAVVQAYEELAIGQVRTAAANAISVLDESTTEAERRLAEAEALLAENPDDSVLQAQHAAATGELVDLTSRSNQLATDAALYGSGVRLYVAPAPPPESSQPRPLRNTAVAFALGLVGAGIWAWWADSEP